MVFIFTGCGKGFEEENKIQFEVYARNYIATLKPINRYFRNSKATLKASVAENQLWVRVFYFGSNSDNAFIQLIHSGSSCPNSKSDTNHDGHVDFEEAVAASGRIFIPLDANLSSRFRGLDKFPSARKKGKYYYSESANFEFMVRELADPLDDFTLPFDTLENVNDFQLANKVFIIYGIRFNTRLPSSFRSYHGYSEQELYPILCGIITRG